jgi:hypothetical protein
MTEESDKQLVLNAKEKLRSASFKYTNAAKMFEHFQTLSKQECLDYIQKHSLLGRNLRESDWRAMQIEELAMPEEDYKAMLKTMSASKTYWKNLALETLQEKDTLQSELDQVKAKAETDLKAAYERAETELGNVKTVMQQKLTEARRKLEENKDKQAQDMFQWGEERGQKRSAQEALQKLQEVSGSGRSCHNRRQYTQAQWDDWRAQKDQYGKEREAQGQAPTDKK